MIRINFCQLAPHIVTLACALAPFYVQGEQLYYRVINESGNIELKANLSPEEAKRGYSIVSSDGYIVEEVAPELSADELAAKNSERETLAEARKKQKDQEEYGYALLLRFSSMQDLYAEKDRKLREFDVRISILRSNQNAIKEKLDIQQKRAADTERLGREVPEAISQNIAELETEIQGTNATIEQLLAEKQLIEDKYERDGEWLQTLLGQGNEE